jgi:hypothetical protein
MCCGSQSCRLRRAKLYPRSCTTVRLRGRRKLGCRARSVPGSTARLLHMEPSTDRAGLLEQPMWLYAEYEDMDERFIPRHAGGGLPRHRPSTAPSTKAPRFG